jgi:hypothetical protein
LKWLDCVSICTPRIGQEAALAGLRLAADWRAGVRSRIAGLQVAFAEVMASQPGGFELITAGAYFGRSAIPTRSFRPAPSWRA